MTYELGNDIPNKDKGIQILILLVSLVIISWFGTNYPKLWDTARTFWLLGMFSMIGILVAFLLNKTFGIDLNVPISEEPNILGIDKKYLYIFSFIAFIATFFIISQTSYSMLPPGFQVVELGALGESLLYISAAIAENFFFFCFLLGLIFTMLRYYLGPENILLILALLCLIIPTLFMLYHFFVYGFVDMINSMATFIFALEMTLWMILFKDLTYTHMRHIGNNLGIMVFTTYTLTSLFVEVITSFWFWLIAIIILGFYIRRRM